MKLLNRNWGSIRERSRRRLIAWHLRALQLSYKERAVPLRYWLLFRSAAQGVFRSPDPLFPPEDFVHSSGASLRPPELRELLRDDLLGRWALAGDTISFLWKGIRRDRPRIFMECGAGVSTLVLAKSLALHGSGLTNSPLLISLEQDIEIKQALERRLEECGLRDHVQILHTPISEQGDYKLDTNKLEKQLGSEKVDWLIIDGPAGPEGCRLSTLPSLARFCRTGARWFLDDAFRDGELRILNQWLRLPGIVVEGVYPIGKGLGAGIVTEPQKVGVL